MASVAGGCSQPTSAMTSPDQGGPYKEAWNYKLTHYHQFKEMVIGDQICYDCGDDAPLLAQVDNKKEAETSVTRRPTPNTANASV